MNIPRTFTIATEHYLLRAPSREDIPFVFSATRVNGFNDGMQWEPPVSEEELLLPLESGRQAWENGEGYSFAIVAHKDKGILLGRVSIRKTQQTDQWDVGFWTHPEAQGKGVMTEALIGVLQFGFEQLNANSITAAYATWNKASERVLQKTGFTFVKHIEQGFKKKGEWVAEHLMVLEKQNFEMYSDSK